MANKELELYNTRLRMQALVTGEKPLYEWGNILDRLMINLYNSVPSALDKARTECREKHIDPVVIDRVESLLRAQRANIQTSKITSKILPDKHTREMYVFLKSRYTKLNDNELARCVLRYASLGQGGQQWALNRAMMSRIRKLGMTTEAFASPFNNYFTRYFSIFRGDAPFGSLGSFFTADEKLLSTGLYANPPFTEAALDAMSMRLEKVASNYPRAKFVIITPTWTDAAWYQRLQKTFQSTLKQDTVYFSLGEEFTPRFTTTLWTRNVKATDIL